MHIKQQLIGSKTILMKDVRRNIRVWKQNLLPPAVNSILYFIIFGHVVGQRIGLIHGYPYIVFIAPGLIIMQLVVNSYINTASFFFISKFDRSIEEIIISPLSPFFILLGYLGGGIYRGIVAGLVVSIIAVVLTHLPSYSIFIIISVALLASVIFSLLGIINGVYAKRFDDINTISTFVLTPLTYLGGVFYSVNLLPPFWQKISFFNPLAYIINTFRYGFFGVSDNSIWIGFAIMISLTGLLFFLAYWLIKHGVNIIE